MQKTPLPPTMQQTPPHPTMQKTPLPPTMQKTPLPPPSLIQERKKNKTAPRPSPLPTPTHPPPPRPRLPTTSPTIASPPSASSTTSCAPPRPVEIKSRSIEDASCMEVPRTRGARRTPLGWKIDRCAIAFLLLLPRRMIPKHHVPAKSRTTPNLQSTTSPIMPPLKAAGKDAQLYEAVKLAGDARALTGQTLDTDNSPSTPHHRPSPPTPHHRQLTTDTHHRQLTTDNSPPTPHHRPLTTDPSPPTTHHRHLTLRHLTSDSHSDFHCHSHCHSHSHSYFHSHFHSYSYSHSLFHFHSSTSTSTSTHDPSILPLLH
ncbi:uncharacterized protein MYCGRDRAFT_111768 [Zymoseptoria tritici IPO323]|uniref:Uncharacterized protein n=1 Tax=Zymoseptoria tritici (strain CBS 115943 / IPO323) TaxID=336722 RepID=F9XRK9_ZYMTI|nr:uncharacterized protein MYCGRDRAFT_111768 [Zymoseptoria tritici IPO323]EGP82110.1 hypothetical protein MYCGRDRAFT_111768 [Zymoseptoria tritici IPO323]